MANILISFFAGQIVGVAVMAVVAIRAIKRMRDEYAKTMDRVYGAPEKEKE